MFEGRAQARQHPIANRLFELDGVAENLLEKYSGMANFTPEAIAAARANIEAGNSWVFELQPR